MATNEPSTKPGRMAALHQPTPAESSADIDGADRQCHPSPTRLRFPRPSAGAPGFDMDYEGSLGFFVSH